MTSAAFLSAVNLGSGNALNGNGLRAKLPRAKPERAKPPEAKSLGGMRKLSASPAYSTDCRPIFPTGLARTPQTTHFPTDVHGGSRHATRTAAREPRNAARETRNPARDRESATLAPEHGAAAPARATHEPVNAARKPASAAGKTGTLREESFRGAAVSLQNAHDPQGCGPSGDSPS